MDVMVPEELELLAVAAVAATLLKKKKRRKRRVWAKDWLGKKESMSHVYLLQELKSEPVDWRNYLRMDEETYEMLLSLVTPYIAKQNTCMRSAISPHERLSATLRFLATGRSYEDLKFSTCISPQALGRIIPETCRAIREALQPDYMKVSTIDNTKYF